MSHSRQALLVMDMEKGITQYFPHELVDRFATVLAAARANGVPVIHVLVRWRPGLQEVSKRNHYIAPLASSGVFVEGAEAAEIDPRLVPVDGEVVTVHRRVSAFGGSDLAMVLSGIEADHLVLGGIGTSGVVLSTVMAATELDFGLTVLKDCSATRTRRCTGCSPRPSFPRTPTCSARRIGPPS